jgi:hypothetical protein
MGFSPFAVGLQVVMKVWRKCFTREIFVLDLSLGSLSAEGAA